MRAELPVGGGAVQPDRTAGNLIAAKRTPVGIAFGAGAARGWAHIGVVNRLVEAGIVPAAIAGTSIGALVGGCFAAGRIDTLEEFARSITRRRLFSFLDIAWRGSGLITGDRLRALLEDHLTGVTFEDLQLPFTCIATELMTGHEIWLRSGLVTPAIRASYALPGVFKPVRHDGKWLIDGAVVNPIPVSACRAMGSRLVIAVNLSTDVYGGTVIQHVPRPGPAVLSDNASEGSRDSTLRKMLGRENDPGLTTVLVTAFNITQDRLSRSRLAGDPPDITIVPRTPSIGLFEFDRAAEAISAGRLAAERALPEIERSLAVLDAVQA
jgi:NTE family protein